MTINRKVYSIVVVVCLLVFFCVCVVLVYAIFLAHLSRRLNGELIGYPWIRRPSVVRPFTFSNVFSSETVWPIIAKFYVEPPWEGGTKVYINGPGHMTKMAAMPIYGKTLKNLLLQNQKSYDLETWHVASGTQALQSLYKQVAQRATIAHLRTRIFK